MNTYCPLINKNVETQDQLLELLYQFCKNNTIYCRDNYWYIFNDNQWIISEQKFDQYMDSVVVKHIVMTDDKFKELMTNLRKK